MTTPVRVTAQIMGATVFNTKQATLEWTPQGTIRIVRAEPGEQPVVVLDAPPAGMRQVTFYDTNQQLLVFKPAQGSNVKVSLVNSMLAPEPGESADSYARRQMSLGVPPMSWWADSLAAGGAKVVRFGWGKSFAIAGAIVAGVIAVSLLIAALSGAF